MEVEIFLDGNKCSVNAVDMEQCQRSFNGELSP